MRILIVDNNLMRESWGAKDLSRFATQVAGAIVTVRRAPQGDLPKNISQFDRIVLSGSLMRVNDVQPWTEQLDQLIRKSMDLQKPLLGICYGHQALARALGGIDCVRASPTPEVGWTQIEMLAPSPLLQGVPEVFHSFSMHYDEVFRLPSGMVGIARSERCDIQGMQLRERPVFGIQFHPEKFLEEGERTIANQKKNGDAGNLLNPDRGSKLYDSKIGDRVFENFFSL